MFDKIWLLQVRGLLCGRKRCLWHQGIWYQQAALVGRSGRRIMPCRKPGCCRCPVCDPWATLMLTDADDPVSGVAGAADTGSVSRRCSPALCLGRAAPVAPLTGINSWTRTTAGIKPMCWTGSLLLRKICLHLLKRFTSIFETQSLSELGGHRLH